MRATSRPIRARASRPSSIRSLVRRQTWLGRSAPRRRPTRRRRSTVAVSLPWLWPPRRTRMSISLWRRPGGALCHINNSRRAAYGYDQRVEVFGAKGMVRSDNLRPTAILKSNEAATDAHDPLLAFFVERYAQSYVHEIDDFIAAVLSRRKPSVGAEDGRRALLLADAALQAHRTGRTRTLAAGSSAAPSAHQIAPPDTVHPH